MYDSIEGILNYDAFKVTEFSSVLNSKIDWEHFSVIRKLTSVQYLPIKHREPTCDVIFRNVNLL